MHDTIRVACFVLGSRDRSLSNDIHQLRLSDSPSIHLCRFARTYTLIRSRHSEAEERPGKFVSGNSRGKVVKLSGNGE